jgi:hypothetical protein
MVPAMSKMPTTASSPAAVVLGIPWSCAAGTKCVWMIPFVDHPQTQKVSTRAQNTHRRLARRSTVTATRPGERVTVAVGSAALPGRRP